MEETREMIKVWPRKDISRETYMRRVTSKRGAGRAYELEGTNSEGRIGILNSYPSVTHILSYTTVKHALPQWYAKKVAEKAGEHWQNEYKPRHDTPVDEFIKDIKSAPSEEFKYAGKVGTEAHDLINQAIRYKMDNPYTTWVEVSEEIRPIAASIDMLTGKRVVYEESLVAFDNWMVFIQANYPDIVFLETEFATYIDGHVVSPDHGGTVNIPLYAGTVDAVGLTPDHKLVVFDWKTGSGIYDEAGYQVAAYCNSIWNGNEQLADIYGGITGAVVRLSKTDAEFEVKTITDWERPSIVFKTMCSLYTQLSYPVFDKKARKKKVSNG